MSLRDIIKKISTNRKLKKQKFNELKEDYMLQKILEERQKSSNQRELERYNKEQEERGYTEQLNKIRKKQTKEQWSGKDSILKQENNILNNDRPILKQKNIFKNDKKSSIIKGGNSMGFFK